MKNIDIKEISALWSNLDEIGEANMPLEEFIQYYVDQHKDDWYMYRPVVAQLEKDVIELKKKVKQMELHVKKYGT